MTTVRAEGCGRFESKPPPPPSRPLKVFEPVFVQLEILGKVTGAAGAEEFFEAYSVGQNHFHHTCLYSKCSDFQGACAACVAADSSLFQMPAVPTSL